MKFYIKTFGCQMNKSDSEKIEYVLKNAGHKKASGMKRADLIVINMCSVRQSAVDRVFGLAPIFQELKINNPSLRTLLTGCFLKKDEKKFRKFFDFILPIKSLPSWPEVLQRKGFFPTLSPKSGDAEYLEVCSPSPGVSASIPISTGCNNSCSYCVVPYTRGALACRPHDKIIREARKRIAEGAREIWLLGQNVNEYKSPTDPSIRFPQLLEKIGEIDGDFWIRFASPNPKDFSEKMISAVGDCSKMGKYLNLPVQSGDDTILRKMNRPYTVKQYMDLVDRIRKAVPGIALSTDVIVGFPGETKEQFDNTVKLFKKIKFDMAYIARYSARPDTKAAKIRNKVSEEDKEKRFRALTRVLEKTALEQNKKYVGRNVKVLVMGKALKNNKKFFSGKTSSYKTVYFPQDRVNSKKTQGKFLKVKIKRAFPWGLRAEKLIYE
jgi:tRNA-2-methylthio-N6-dimethylallyladenosine synthase